jgi:hypothetical protein
VSHLFIYDPSNSIRLISCVISIMCQLNEEFYYVNSNTQLALFSVCSGNCSSVINVTWNVYQGSINSSNETFVQWTLLNSMISSWFFGKYLSN